MSVSHFLRLLLLFFEIALHSVSEGFSWCIQYCNNFLGPAWNVQWTKTPEVAKIYIRKDIQGRCCFYICSTTKFFAVKHTFEVSSTPESGPVLRNKIQYALKPAAASMICQPEGSLIIFECCIPVYFCIIYVVYATFSIFLYFNKVFICWSVHFFWKTSSTISIHQCSQNKTPIIN